jgi:hypothetical protein
MGQRLRGLARDLSRNDLFYRFMLLIGVILMIYGLGMTIVILSEGTSNTIAIRMLNIFAAAFASFVSFGAGFLFGAGSLSVKDKDKE